MIKVVEILDVNELVKYWPRLLNLAKSETSDINPEQLLQLYLSCLSNGALFAVRNDTGLCGVCGVKANGDYLLELKVIPNDKGTGVAKECIKVIKDWAVEHDFSSIQVSSSRLYWSAFRYFAQTFGFHRNIV